MASRQLFEAALLKIAALPNHSLSSVSGQAGVSQVGTSGNIGLSPDANLLGSNFDSSQGQQLRNPPYIFGEAKNQIDAGGSTRMHEGKRNERGQDGRLRLGGGFYLSISPHFSSNALIGIGLFDLCNYNTLIL